MNGELFLEQYKQVWEQRRQHVGLIWKIPTISSALVVGLLNAIDFEKLGVKLSTKQVHFLFVSLVLYGFGSVMLLLRHNFFVGAYGLLLKRMQNDNKFRRALPQRGKDLRRLFYSRLSCWEKLGSWPLFDGMISWSIIFISITLSIITLWPGLYNLLFLILERICQALCCCN